MLAVLLAIVAATALMFGYLVFIWWLDRYEREPLWVVLLTFFYGAVFGTCFSCIVNSSIGAIAAGIVSKDAAKIFTTVAVAPTVEELMKGCVFIPLLLFGKNIDGRTDGLIYGAAVGLGFSTLENLWYYMNNYNAAAPDELFALIFMRTLFTALVHAVSSALLGMSIGYARHRRGMGKLLFPIFGYGCAVMFHGTWNGIASFAGFKKDEVGVAALLIGCLLVVGASLFMFILTQLSLHSEHKVMRRYLLDEAARGVLPSEHADIVPFWRRRWRSDWVPSGVNKQDYIKAATLLAFRRHQMDLAGEHAQQRYMEDVATYRAQLRKMLGRS